MTTYYIKITKNGKVNLTHIQKVKVQVIVVMKALKLNIVLSVLMVLYLIKTILKINKINTMDHYVYLKKRLFVQNSLIVLTAKS